MLKTCVTPDPNTMTLCTLEGKKMKMTCKRYNVDRS